MTQQVNRASNVGRGQGAWPGGAQGDREAGPEGPQALQVPQGRRDLCVCVGGQGCTWPSVALVGQGNWKRSPVGGAGLGWEPGETQELWGKERGRGTPGIYHQDTPASATPEPRPRTEAEVPSPPTPRALPCGRSGLEHLKSVRKASHGQACGWGAPALVGDLAVIRQGGPLGPMTAPLQPEHPQAPNPSTTGWG